MMEDNTSGRPGQSGSCGCGSPARPVIKDVSDLHSHVRNASEFSTGSQFPQSSEPQGRGGGCGGDPPKYPVINDMSDLHSHVRDASEFSDVNRHRSDPRDRVSARDPQTRANRASDERGCGTDSRIFRDYDWSALIPFVDLEHEVVLVEDERDEPDRRSQPKRRLKVIDGLEVFEAIPPDQGGGLNIKAKGPGGIPPAPSEGLDLKGPKVPIVFGKDIKAPKPPIAGGTDIETPPIPQKGIQASEYYICPGNLDHWHKGAHYRTAKLGKDQCSDSEEDAVNDAFVLAYQLVRAAEVEMAEWVSRSTEDKRYFWQAYNNELDSTLETWFGGAYMPFFEERFALVYATLQAMSFRYRHGFYSYKNTSLNIPVTFNCRPEQTDATASHNTVNFITLKDRWWNWTAPANQLDMRRVMTIIHEMSHWSRVSFAFPAGLFNVVSMYVIQDYWFDDLDDRKDDSLCTGKDNKCYRPSRMSLGFWEWGSNPVLPIQKPFVGDTGNNFTPFPGLSSQIGNPNANLSDPTRLVLNFENQAHDNVMHQMMGNIDNFVCYLWNRWVDHGYCRLDTESVPES